MIVDTWLEWLVLMIGGSLGFWILSTALDKVLDKLLQRRVRKELDALNKEAKNDGA